MPDTECIPLRLTDEPGDVMLLTVEAGTRFTDEELEALREWFLLLREHAQSEPTPEGVINRHRDGNFDEPMADVLHEEADDDR